MRRSAPRRRDPRRDRDLQRRERRHHHRGHTTASGNQQLAGVKLTPPNGGNASGSALFGVAGGSQLYVDVKLNGLKPAPKGRRT